MTLGEHAAWLVILGPWTSDQKQNAAETTRSGSLPEGNIGLRSQL